MHLQVSFTFTAQKLQAVTQEVAKEDALVDHVRIEVGYGSWRD